MRAVAVGVMIAISVSVASAQSAKVEQAGSALPPTSSPVICDMNAVTPPSYMSCGLRFEQGRLRRGASGQDLARPSGFSPIPLTELVRGDSARRYAQQYEDYTWTSSAFKGIGLAVLAVAAVAGKAPGCEWPRCAMGRTNQSRVLAITGFTLFGLSVPFAGMAREAGTKALWWHNAWLGR